MKKLIFALVLSVLALGTVSCGKYEKVASDPMKSKIYTLDNGLKVYMTVNKEEPRIQTYIAVRVGGKNDPSETTGLAHYLEHIMFKGTEQYGTQDYAAEKPLLDEIEQLYEQYRTITDPEERKAHYHLIDSVSYLASQIAIPNEYDKMMSMIGARGTNAWTSEDETVYTEDIPSNQIENWAKIQADRFKSNVIRGFHTELEAVYEEYNRSLPQDSRKMWEALFAGLWPNHPYGQQTVIGTQEHLKNPSITNIKKTYNTYYRPNNVAICMSGDFNPDEAVKIIEKYFGDWEPNPDIPKLNYKEEAAITSPVVKEVVGQEAEMLTLGWRLPAAKDLEVNAIAEIAGNILSNGQAGLIDLDVNQQQKAMFLQAGANNMADYGVFLALGQPKEGQTLDELRDLALAEVAKLRSGDFSEELITSTINNLRLQQMHDLESNRSRANKFVSAFINGIDWKDAANELDRYKNVTKEDVVKFANEYLGENNYVVVYKRQGIDTTEAKIEAPAITPIATNRDKKSAFLQEVENSQVKPINPVYVDFNKDMSKFDLCSGVDVLYKKNETNGIGTLQFIYNRGSEEDPALDYAFDYIPYLGTESLSAEQLATKLYDLACDFRLSSGAHTSTIMVSGLSENLNEAVKLVEDLLYNAVPNEDILAALKADIFKSRADSKTSQRACYSALQNYIYYGPDWVKNTVLNNAAVDSLSSEDLLAAVRDLIGKGHEILYYGPDSESKVKADLKASHKVGENPEVMEEKFTPYVTTPENKVTLANYDSKQFYYLQHSNRGEKFDRNSHPYTELYNEYFGGGMNSIVFQEMREARALAYSAYADLAEPATMENDYIFDAFIGSQNDKLKKAVEGFDEIINELPVSDNAFNVAKEALLSRLRTERTTGMKVLQTYRYCRRMGLDAPLTKETFEKVQNLTLDDVIATQQKWIKDRTYVYAILGSVNDLDTEFLSTLGPVEQVSLEDIFGY